MNLKFINYTITDNIYTPVYVLPITNEIKAYMLPYKRVCRATLVRLKHNTNKNKELIRYHLFDYGVYLSSREIYYLKSNQYSQEQLIKMHDAKEKVNKIIEEPLPLPPRLKVERQEFIRGAIVHDENFIWYDDDPEPL